MQESREFKICNRPDILRATSVNGSVVAASEVHAWLERQQHGDESLSELLLNGIGQGLVQYARGLAVLHGSSVGLGDAGVAIVGGSGMGKSTLAAMLCKTGWSFVSDVMVAVDPETRVMARQQPRWRLRDDSLAAIGEDPSQWPIDDELTLKRRYSCRSDQICSNSQVLRYVVVIELAPQLELRELNPMQCIVAMVSNSYLATRIVPDFSGRLLEMAGALQAGGVRVVALRYPHNWQLMSDVDRALRALLERGVASLRRNPIRG